MLPMQYRIALSLFVGFLLFALQSSGQSSMSVFRYVAIAGVPSALPSFIEGMYADEAPVVIATTTIALKNKPYSLSRYPKLRKLSAKPAVAIPDTDVTNQTVSNADTAIVNMGVKEEIADNDQPAIDDDAPRMPGDASKVIHKYAGMIEKQPTELRNYSLYTFIDNWYGARYKYGGADRSGIDCSAFSQRLYDDIYGVDLERTARQQRRSCDRIKQLSDAKEGDLVFFHVRSFRVSHVGVYLANGYFVHASRSQGVVISSLNSRYWRRRLATCGRMPMEDKEVSESDFIP
jgi:lipoprotein Spr